MNKKMTCEEFNSRLMEFTLGEVSEEEAALMEGHLSSCAGCREILEIKQALVFEPQAMAEDVPDEIERALIDAVISDVSASREAGHPGRSWASRFLMPAMAAAIVIFVFLTGFMLSEIRSLHRQAGELREDVAGMETVLSGKSSTADELYRGRSVFGAMSGGFKAGSYGMTIGDAARLLRELPPDTPVLSAVEAESLIAGNQRLRRFAGYIDEKPWDDGLTSGELLLVIIKLDIDPETRIPDGWHGTY